MEGSSWKIPVESVALCPIYAVSFSPCLVVVIDDSPLQIFNSNNSSCNWSRTSEQVHGGTSPNNLQHYSLYN